MNRYLGVMFVSVLFSACAPTLVSKKENATLPDQYGGMRNQTDTQDTTNAASVNWKEYFSDPFLQALVDTALRNNQELNILLQEIDVSRNEVRARKGEYLPFLGVGGSAEVEKVGRYTSQGANDANTEIEPGREMPDPLPDFRVGAYASWEVDIWNKLHNASKAALYRYLASVEGKNFMVTHLIAEIANSYYELLALDNQLAIVLQNIEIQNDALDIVRHQKEAARATELAVRRFEAQVLHTRSLQYDIQQQIVETENKINFLIGRFPQPIERNPDFFNSQVPDTLTSGLPAQLLANRPDIRQAESELAAAKLDVKVARARFYPSLGISAGLGFDAFNPSYLLKTPESLIYSLAGEITAPLVNRNAIMADYNSANAKQIQAVFNYERTILSAYLEVVNQLSNIHNLEQKYELKSQQMDALTMSVEIANDLFRSARADYMEVLLTQRDALETRFELVETKKQQMNAMVNVYQALGGGWR